MKKLITILLMFALFISVNVEAQKYYYTPANDTVSADTNTYAGIQAKGSTGIIIFEFYHKDVADSLSFARLEGSMDNTNFTALTGNAALSATTTDGTSIIYTVTALKYRWYRVRLACASGDSVALTNMTLMYKRGMD